jgi:hypothetical protein
MLNLHNFVITQNSCIERVGVDKVECLTERFDMMFRCPKVMINIIKVFKIVSYRQFLYRHVTSAESMGNYVSTSLRTNVS